MRRSSIRTSLTVIFIGFAVLPLLVVGAILGLRSYYVLGQEALNSQHEAALRVSAEVSAFIQRRQDELRMIIEVRGLSNMLPWEKEETLAVLASYQDAFRELSLIDFSGRERVHISTVSIVETGDTRDWTNNDAFVKPLASGEIYYGPVRFDEQTGEPSMTISLPLVNLRDGKADYVLVAEVALREIWSLIASLDLEGGESVYITDATNRVIAHRNPSEVLRGTTYVLPEESGTYPGLKGADSVIAFNSIPLGEQTFTVVTERPVSEALALAIDTIQIVVAIIVAVTVIAVVLGLFIVRGLTSPLQKLAKAAQQLQAGEWQTRTEVESQNEFGRLAEAFNTMAGQIEEFFTSMEEKINLRTRDLQAVAEVNRRISTILEVERLLQDVVDMTKERFGLYHAHIYSMNEAGDTLILTSGAGHVGREMVSENRTIAMDNAHSIVAHAANTRRSVAVEDVTQSPAFLAHPLLPNTRSEFAIPLVARGQLLGVLDVQSDVVGYFNDEEVQGVLELMTSQIASAISNARLFEMADRTSRHERALGVIDRKLQDAVDMDEILQVAVRELGKALRVPYTAIELKAPSNTNGDNVPATNLQEGGE